MTLKELQIGKSAVITKVGGEGALRQHFLDMGMIPGAEVTVVKLAPMGDPMEVQIHGYELTLRLTEAEEIEIEQIQKRTRDHRGIEQSKNTDHPGLGESGKYHSRDHENPVPEGTILTYALVGNQNCGKTTLFNQLTGARQHVGNFPGVTVDRKDGVIRGYENTEVTDLPGIYSMSPYSSEEIVSRNFVLNEKPRAIINIVDATNIERNLYLTMQLLEMDIPMVVALNMMDEVVGNQGAVDVNTMEAMLGVPVIPISAAKNEGVDELIRHAIHIAKYQECPVKQDFCDKEDHNGAVHRCIHAVVHLIEDHAEEGERLSSKSVDRVVFEHVSFQYPSADAPTLKHIDLTFKNGEKIAIVGENGAGKTTLIKLLCGLYAPTGGRILLNGKDIATIAKTSYFDLFSAIFQDYYFLPMTIQQNITASLDYDREKFDLALQKAEMYDKVYALPKGADTLMDRNVYKDAVDFSGGEKQKLLLAKAMYKDAPILILDEPTAALDPIAENQLYLKYSELTDGKLSFFISHRLSSTRFCDRILFVSGGQITEMGTHEELMAKKGAYYKMFQVQSYYYREQGVAVHA